MRPSTRLAVIGAGLIVLAGALQVFLPYVGYGMLSVQADGQDLMIGLSVAVQFAGTVLPPLGAALLAAGLVLRHLVPNRVPDLGDIDPRGSDAG